MTRQPDSAEKYNDIPEEGSLGILAIGFQGVLAWRRKKEEIKAMREKRAGFRGKSVPVP